MKHIAVLTLCALIFPFAAHAECELQFFPVNPKPNWIENVDICSDEIRSFIEARSLGFEHYGGALERLSELTPSQQLDMVLNVDSGVTLEGEFERDLLLPTTLIQAILTEAIQNGADEFFEIPGYEEVLVELREASETESGDTFNRLSKIAPVHTDKIFFVNAVRRANERLDAARADHDAARADHDAARAVNDAARAAEQAGRELNDLIDDDSAN